MILKTLDHCDVQGKHVLVRVDFNVPIVNGQISDLTRIKHHVPTILDLQKNNAKIILMSHFGRPKKQKNAEFSLKQIVVDLEKTLGQKISFIDDITSESALKTISNMKNGDIVLLENMRFFTGEEENSPEFIQQLAKFGDIFVQDAFSAAHRAHASTVGLASQLPTIAGRAMQAELEALNMVLEKPTHPVIAIVGGAKVSTKINLLSNLIQKVDALVIGGAMANTFLLAQGYEVGKSLAEPDLVDTAKSIMAHASDAQCAIILPIDAVVAWHFKQHSPHKNYGVDAIPHDGMILDIGDASRDRIISAIDDAKTLLWNGPLGAFEMSPFNAGTISIAKAVADRTSHKHLISIAGGGDTVSTLNQAKVTDDFSYVSTAGGAFLEWLEGNSLPGVDILYQS